MADSEAVRTRQTNLPSGQIIYDLITANNLEGIRSIFNPLTLRNRQSIVHQKIYNKSFLVYACELGSRDIVRYLLDECGAEISVSHTSGHKCMSALGVAVDKLDIAMIVILISRGIVKINRSDMVLASNEAYNNRYYYLSSLLVYYSNCFEQAKFFPWGLGEIGSDKFKMPLVFSWITDMILSNRTEDFLSAAILGNTGIMKTLLAEGINKNVSTEFDDNALCVTICNGDRNAEHFLINYKVYSVREYVMALESSGAKLIVFRSQFEKGLRCWRKALRIRNEYFLGLSDKWETRLMTDLGLEFQTEAQLAVLQSKEKDLYIQGLIVLRRLLSCFSGVLVHAYMTVATYDVFQTDLFMCIDVLAELFEFPSESAQRFRTPSRRSVDAMNYILRTRFVSQSSVMDDVLLKFRNLIDFLDEDKWPVMLRGAPNFYVIVYVQLLEIVLENLVEIQKFDLTDEDNAWIKEGVGNIQRHHTYPYSSTLLHMAVKGKYPLSLIKFILGCSNDANCLDPEKNTPLHYAAEHVEDNAHLSSLVNLLVDAGGHVDAVNMFNRTPLMDLEPRGIIKNPVNFMSLQCLAARNISESGTEIPNVYPKILTRFIKLHDKKRN